MNDNILPITEFEDSYNGYVVNKNCIPLCPHCRNWSYYTTKDEKDNGGYTVCPFCNGKMYMPKDVK